MLSWITVASKKFIQEEGKQEARVLASPDSQGKGHLYGGATITQALCFFLLINSGIHASTPTEEGRSNQRRLERHSENIFKQS